MSCSPLLFSLGRAEQMNLVNGLYPPNTEGGTAPNYISAPQLIQKFYQIKSSFPALFLILCNKVNPNYTKIALLIM